MISVVEERQPDVCGPAHWDLDGPSREMAWQQENVEEVRPMMTNFSTEVVSRQVGAEPDLECEYQFVSPGYLVVDDALHRFQESDPKGFSVGKFNNEDRNCAAHLMAYLLDDKDTFYHRFSDIQDEFGFRDPELLNRALNLLIRVGVIRLDVSVRGGKDVSWFAVHADYREY